MVNIDTIFSSSDEDEVNKTHKHRPSKFDIFTGSLE